MNRENTERKVPVLFTFRKSPPGPEVRSGRYKRLKRTHNFQGLLLPLLLSLSVIPGRTPSLESEVLVEKGITSCGRGVMYECYRTDLVRGSSLFRGWTYTLDGVEFTGMKEIFCLKRDYG